MQHWEILSQLMCIMESPEKEVHQKKSENYYKFNVNCKTTDPQNSINPKHKKQRKQRKKKKKSERSHHLQSHTT